MKNGTKKTVIFPCYHKKALIFENNVYKPIQTGCEQNGEFSGFLHDNKKDNISIKNPNYGELTAVYEVWKNYLKDYPQVDYVGFCHYRRFFDFKEKKKFSAFKPEESIIFREKIWKKNTEKKINDYIEGYDVIVPAPIEFEENILDQYLVAHPKEVIDKFIEIIKKDYPWLVDIMNDFLSGNKMYPCLNYVMKKELFEDWCKFIFDILFKIEKEIDFSSYTTYDTVRAPAFAAERFFNVWLMYMIKNKNIKIKETPTYILEDLNTKIYPFLIGEIITNKYKIILKLFGIKLTLSKEKLFFKNP